MLTNLNQLIIPNYSPITSKGGRRRSRKYRSRKNKRSKTHLKNGRTRRRYH